MTEKREEKPYYLARSALALGPIYPVILDKDGRVVDGFHRLEENPHWPTEKREWIDTPLKYYVARFIANTFRRDVTMKERREIVAHICEILTSEQEIPKGKMSEVIANLLHISERYARMLLPDKYKMITRRRQRTLREFAEMRSAKELEKIPGLIVLCPFCGRFMKMGKFIRRAKEWDEYPEFAAYLREHYKEVFLAIERGEEE